MAQHAIKKHVFEFTCGSEEVAKSIRQEYVAYAAPRMQEIIAALFNKQVPEDRTLVIDKLEIDLGAMRLQDFAKEEMLRRFSSILSEKIAAVQPTAITEKEPQTSLEGELSIARHFLLHGDVPWWVDKSTSGSPDELMQRLIREHPQAVRSLLESAKANAGTALRIATQYKAVTRKMMERLSPAFARAVAAWSGPGMFPEVGRKQIGNKYQLSANGARLLKALFSGTDAFSEGAGKQFLVRKLLKAGGPDLLTQARLFGFLSADQLQAGKAGAGKLHLLDKKEKAGTVLSKLSLPQLRFLYWFVSGAGRGSEVDLPEMPIEEVDHFPDKTGGENQYDRGRENLSPDGLAQESTPDRAGAEVRPQLALDQGSAIPLSSGQARLSNTASEKEQALFESGHESGASGLPEQTSFPPEPPAVPDADKKEGSVGPEIFKEPKGSAHLQDKPERERQLAAGEQNRLEEQEVMGEAPEGTKVDQGARENTGQKKDSVNQTAEAAHGSDASGGASAGSETQEEHAASTGEATTISTAASKTEHTVSKETPAFKEEAALSVPEARVVPRQEGATAGNLNQPELGLSKDATAEGVQEAGPDISKAEPGTNRQVHPASGAAVLSPAKSAVEKKEIAFLLKNLGSTSAALAHFLEHLDQKGRAHLKHILRKGVKGGAEHKKAVDALLQHPYTLQYNLLHVVLVFPLPPAPHKASAKVDTSGRALPHTLVNKIKAVQSRLLSVLNRLPLKETVVVQDVLEKKELASESERSVLKTVFLKFPPAAVSFMQFLSSLPEEELQQLASPVGAAATFTAGHHPDGQGKVYIENAGLCLLAPYLPGLFQHLDYLENRKFSNKFNVARAACLLHYIATGEQKCPEYLLPFNKLLCGLAVDESIAANLRLNRKETEEADSLLESVIANWKILKNTSVEGFRISFLQRKGILVESDLGWTLQVERKAHDLLLDAVPWGFRMIRLPWMKKLIEVEW